MNARIVIALPDATTAVWHGGAYIDILDYDENAIDTINVWDYEADRPLIPFTPEAMRERVSRYLAEQEEAS